MLRRSIWVLLLLSCSALEGWAIATADDEVSASEPSGYGYDLDWSYVYRYKGASSVAVDHYWILTATHVADDGGTGSLTIDGETYTQQEVVFHDSADLALVRYDKPLPGYYSLYDGALYTGSGRRKTWMEFVMLGYGFTGSVANSYFTQSGLAGTKRWGTNRGSSQATPTVDVGYTGGARTTACFTTTFSLSDTPYEAGGNVYDSGGPCFVDDNGTWKLAGINLYRSGTNPYTGNYAAEVSKYISWIKEVIPDYDSDMDGLPDWWETQYVSSSTAMAPAGDLDADGFSNYQEWLADTDPSDETSFFSMNISSGGSLLSFTSSSDRSYRVEYCLDLGAAAEEWVVESDWFAGLSGETSQALTVPATNRFYRVRARM